MSTRARLGAALVAAATLVVALPGTAAAAVSVDEGDVTPAQARASQWWLSTLGVSDAQQVTRGAGVKVCVIDEGVDPTHPDLQGTRFLPGMDEDGTGSPDGLEPVGNSSHGSQMVAMIAGQGRGPGHREGIIGVAPQASIISVSGVGGASTKALNDSVKFCADQGAQVINLSLIAVLDRTAIAYAQARDVVLVAGTGNGGSRKGISGIAGSWGVLGVGGVDADLTLDPHSSVAGPSFLLDEPWSEDNGGVAVMGPYATKGAPVGQRCKGFWGLRDYQEVRKVYGDYRMACGTSEATAFTSGVVALVRAAHPELNAANVVNRILKTAKPPTDGSAVPSDTYGFGVVDADAAVTAQVPLVEHNPLGSCYTGSRGIWDHRLGPQRPEPPVGATLPPAAWDASPAPVDGNTLPGTTTNTTENDSGAGLTWLLVGSGAVLALLVLVGGGIWWALSRRRDTRPGPAAYPGGRSC